MTLRRTAMKRRTPIRRASGPSRTPLGVVRAPAGTKPRKDTGPSQAQKRVVAERAGWCCEVCGKQLHDGDAWIELHAFHHRQPRGMGGTSRPDIHAPYQLLLVCGLDNTIDGCHAGIEQNRTAAYELGWLVRSGLDPAKKPVYLTGGLWALLGADGAYEDVVA